MASYVTADQSGQVIDDGTRELKIFGCEYRFSKQSLVDFLNHYGELLTDIVKELFEDGGSGDPETDGT